MMNEPLSTIMTRDIITLKPEETLEAVIQTGAKRILTSGLAPSVSQGVATLKQLSQLAKGRIAIMAGCGVRPDNVKMLVQNTNVQAVHFTARTKEKIDDKTDNQNKIAMGTNAEDDLPWEVDHSKIQAIVRSLNER